MDADATQAEDDEPSPGFFSDVIDGPYSSRTYGNYYRSSARRPRPLVPSFETANTLFDGLLSPFRCSHHTGTDDATELQQRPRRSIFSRDPRIVGVAAVKDREVIFTAPPPPRRTQQRTQSQGQGSFTIPPVPGNNPTTPRSRHPHPLPVRLLAHLVLFLCCASPQHANGNGRPTQQQPGQP